MTATVETTQRTFSSTREEGAFSLKHVSLAFESGQQVLADISLEVEPGEHICILGPNGSGKSTLASVICGLLAPDAGEVTLVGERVFGASGIDLEAYRRARRSLGLVFQNPDDQIVTSIVEDDVAFGPENLGLPREEIARRVRENLHHVALQDYAHADPSRLSGGQKQRVAIAGALALEPSVLVLDEPGALLDVRGRRSIVELMERLNKRGVTIVHITHFMEEALAADRVIVLDQGRIVLQGTPEEAFSQVDAFRTLGLEEPFAARLSGLLRDRSLPVRWTCSETALREEIMQLVGKKAEAGNRAAVQTTAAAPADQHGAQASSDKLVEVDQVFFSYGSRGRRGAARRSYALDDISFSIRRGESVAIVGQTGSGKSTLLRLICALEQPDAGSIRICGFSTSDKRGRRALRSHIGYVMQHPERQLFAESVAQDVAFGPRNLGLAPEEVAQRVNHALELIGLSDKRDASPFELSGGQQRLAAIAGVLAMEPEILVLDEPTAGLDPRGRASLRALLADLHDHDITVIQVTHSMEDAARCARVIVLDNSKLLFDGDPHGVFSRAHAQRLRACGLGLPASLRCAYALEDEGLSCLGEPLSTQALADALAQVMS